ncbi:hypothetical protein Zm00014a_011002 [Zea mays]|uniref:Uncharacterized protein n=1 Tax=Zea mays TaxID=4577 RepID=A0A3L6DQ32_MAIZE|nr:hypothetical protein Zm00014a_011002 [Zea mays]
MRSKSSPPSQSSMTRCTAPSSSHASRRDTMLGLLGRCRMMATSRRTSSTSTGVRSFRLEMDLQASSSRVPRSMHRYVTPNSPRPSSRSSAYFSSIPPAPTSHPSSPSTDRRFFSPEPGPPFRACWWGFFFPPAEAGKCDDLTSSRAAAAGERQQFPMAAARDWEWGH